MASVVRHLLLSLGAGLMSACSSTHAPVTLALTELGSASKAEYGADHLNFIRAVSIHGLAGEEVVGTLTKDPDPPLFNLPEPWSSKDLPDSLSPRVASTCSKVIDVTFAHDDEAADPATLALIRNKLQMLEQATAQALRVELDLRVVDALAAELATLPAEAQQTELLKSFATAWPQLGVSDAASLPVAQARLAAALDAAQGELNQLRGELDRALSTPGIVVTRWTRASKSRFSLSALFGGANRSRDAAVNGYLILGAPRISTLVIGDDLVYRIQRPDKERTGIDSFTARDRLYTAIHQLRAKAFAYSESRTEALTVSLKADLKAVAEKLGSIVKTPGNKLAAALQAYEVKLEGEFSRVTDVGTTGLLKTGTTRMHEFRFHGDADYAESVRAELVRSQGYRPIYTARATLEAIRSGDGRAPIGKDCLEPANLAVNLLDERERPVAWTPGAVDRAVAGAARTLLGAAVMAP